MSEDEKIYVDVSRPATLHNGAISTDFPTLQDAIMAWHKLRPEQAQRASIRIIGGSYTQRWIYRSCSMDRGRGNLTFSAVSLSRGQSHHDKYPTLVAISFLVTLGLGPSIAMPPQEIPSEVKACKAIADGKERLKCFDDCLAKVQKPQNPPKEHKRTGQSMKPNRLLMAVLRLSRRIS